ncbi:ATP-binding protein [Hyphococcus flavus]|uniref:ATP-binding protein n=1 Tax=Hyphococcus flavus TaxID=1866326 RepID=A0AAF0CH31_9PROT|nr:ATP-binding protein [Hyphococcus flavus]WDI32983.1 ATP-binding protein [Hyphococcus flavus]
MFFDTIDEELKKLLRPAKAHKFSTNKKILPAYRYVDVRNAIKKSLEEYNVETVTSSHYEDLSPLLTGEAPAHMHRKLNKASNISWSISEDDEDYFPEDQFWVGKASDKQTVIIRLRYFEHSDNAILECGSEQELSGKNLMKAVLERSVRTSIYRGNTLRLSYESGTRDEYGDIEKPSRFRVLFQSLPAVDKDEFVLEAQTRETLQRNVIDLFSRKDALNALNVPIRRGILLYGPPGTGKTFSCRFLAQQLDSVTKFFVTGRALNQVSAIFSIARLYKPSCIFLEDADLAFAARDINVDAGGLGELLDQLDGLRTDDEIVVIVTTNSMERLESALKDRPGRISQCIYFGPPVAVMRERYLRQYLAGFETTDLDFSKLVFDSEGSTQAFLREWVHRALQIGSEEKTSRSLRLTNTDFDRAMDEMTRDADYFGQSLIGFTPSRT